MVSIRICVRQREIVIFIDRVNVGHGQGTRHFAIAFSASENNLRIGIFLTVFLSASVWDGVSTVIHVTQTVVTLEIHIKPA